MKNATTILLTMGLLAVVAACDKGRVCNEYGPKYSLMERCDDGEVCCSIRQFETEACIAGDHCPAWHHCPRADNLYNGSCVGSYCLYTAPPIDAGVKDAGPADSDAGVKDAGPADSDAGVKDAGPADSDAGVKDAGPVTSDAAPAAACVAKWDSSCIEVCPPEDQCGPYGDECCGAGTHCEQDCCVLD